MNKSSLDSELVKGGNIKEEGGREGVLPEFKLLYSFFLHP